jgi:Synergist-CTERM protein sorting domain-containing protein
MATVANGVITALAEGLVTITASANDGSGIKATCAVTIEPPLVSGDVTFPSDKDDVSNKTGISPDDLEKIGDKIYLKKKLAEDIAKKLLKADEVDVVILPVFEADVDPTGGIFQVKLKVTGKDLLAEFADDINLIGMISPKDGALFEYVGSLADYGDGKFTLLKDGVVFDGKIEPNAEYELVAFIKDGGKFDLDKIVNGKVISSLFLAAEKGGRKGGGGCNAYGFTFALLAVVPLVLRRKA